MSRRTVWVALAASLSTLLAVAGPVPRAAACTCLAGVAEAEYRSDADVVFTGTVLARHPPAPWTPAVSTAAPVTWRFAVDGTVKGAATEQQDVDSPWDSNACGVVFEAGRRYRVYATRRGATLATNVCAGTHAAVASGLPGTGRGSAAAPAGLALFGLGVGLLLSRIRAFRGTNPGATSRGE